jgi:hypothetical protein
MMKPLPISTPDLTARQHSVVKAALLENPPSGAFGKALAEGRELHGKYKEICRLIQNSLHQNVSLEYQRLVNEASERVISGDAAALADLESQADITSRFEAERTALHQAIKKNGLAQVPVALVLLDGIDGALGKLANRLEARDAVECDEFGLELQFSAPTRLVHAVRIQLFKQTGEVRRSASIDPTERTQLSIATTFGDFLDLADW